MNKEKLNLYLKENKSTIIIVIITLVLTAIATFFITWIFTPDPNKEVLKKHELEREQWAIEMDSVSKRGDSLYDLAQKKKHRADSIINKSISDYQALIIDINKKKNEELNSITNDGDEYLNVLSAPRSQ